jgi:hypothetical protein
LDENVVNKHIFSFPDGLVLVFWVLNKVDYVAEV